MVDLFFDHHLDAASVHKAVNIFPCVLLEGKAGQLILYTIEIDSSSPKPAERHALDS